MPAAPLPEHGRPPDPDSGAVPTGAPAPPRRVVLRPLALALILVLAAAGGVAWRLADGETWRDDLAAHLRVAFGTGVTIEGPVTVALLPRLSLSAEAVRLDDRLDALAGRIDRLILTLDPSALLVGAPAVTGVELQRPELRLSLGVPRPADLSGLRRLDSLVIGQGEVRVVAEDGTDLLHFGDWELASTRGMGGGPRLSLSGAGRIDGSRLAAAVTLDDAPAAFAGLPSGLQVTLEDPGNSLGFHGQLLASGHLDGTLSVAAPGLGTLWPALGIDRLAGFAEIDAGPGRLDLSAVDIQSPATRLGGRLSIDWTGAEPRVEGQLSADRLPLPDFLGGLAAVEAPGGPVVVDLTLAARTLTAGSLGTGPGVITIAVDEAGGRVEIAELDVMGGQMVGHVSFTRDAGGFASQLNLSDVDVEALGTEWLGGRAAGELTLTGRAGPELLASLSGAGRLSIEAARLGGGGAGRIDLALALAGPDQPVNLRGEMRLDGQPVTLAVVAGPWSSVVAGSPRAVEAVLETPHGGLSWAAAAEGPGGGAPAAGSPSDPSSSGPSSPGATAGMPAAGSFRFETPDLTRLLTWLGAAPSGPAIGPVSLAGRLAVAEGRFVLDPAELRIDGAGGTGRGTLDLAGARPRLTASLATGPLTPLDWLVAPAGGGWLDALEAEIALGSERLTLGDWQIEAAQTVLTLGEGGLAARLVAGRLAGGAVTGAAQLRADEDGRLIATAQAEATGMEPARLVGLLADVAGLEGGQASAALRLTGTGETLAAAVEALDGSATLRLADAVVDLGPAGRTEPLTLTVTAPALGQPAETRAETVLNGRPVTLTGRLERLADLVAGRAQAVDLTLAAPDFTLSYQGTLPEAPSPEAPSPGAPSPGAPPAGPPLAGAPDPAPGAMAPGPGVAAGEAPPGPGQTDPGTTPGTLALDAGAAATRAPQPAAAPATPTEASPAVVAPPPLPPAGAATPEPQPMFRVSTDHGPRPEVPVGTSVSLFLEADRALHAVCFYQDGGGVISRLFPNRFDTDSLLVPGQRRVVPDGEAFSIIVQAPGEERYLCLADPTDPLPRLPEAVRVHDLSPLEYGAMDEVRQLLAGVSGPQSILRGVTVRVTP